MEHDLDVREELLHVVAGHGEPTEGIQPRGVFVTPDHERWVAIRADGFVMARQGTLDLRPLWLGGAAEADLAGAVLGLMRG